MVYIISLAVLSIVLAVLHQKTIVIIHVSRLAAVVAVLIIIALHWLVHYQNPFDAMVSAYATDPKWGFLMQAAFVLLAMATFGVFAVLGAATKAKKEAELAGGMEKHYSFLAYILLFAGLFTGLMGLFSMRVTDAVSLAYGVRVTTPTEGIFHSIFCFLSFLLATISMLVYACKPTSHRENQSWLRGVALAQFNIALVAVMAFGVLSGINAKKQVVNKSLSTELIAELNPSSVAPNKEGNLPEVQTSAKSVQAVVEEKVVLTRGLGIAERILILLFVEWQFILLFAVTEDHASGFKDTADKELYFFHKPSLSPQKP